MAAGARLWLVPLQAGYIKTDERVGAAEEYCRFRAGEECAGWCVSCGEAWPVRLVNVSLKTGFLVVRGSRGN